LENVQEDLKRKLKPVLISEPVPVVPGFWELDLMDSTLSAEQIHTRFMTDESIFGGVFRGAMQSFGINTVASDWSLETIKKWCKDNHGMFLFRNGLIFHR
jgi:hypothetical protein